MKKQVKRRQFIKTSAFVSGGLCAMNLGYNIIRPHFGLKLTPNDWKLISRENYGARRFSSFRYVPEINRFQTRVLQDCHKIGRASWRETV